jgi:predicted GIY-YIG superfamily endonuclease
LAREAQIKRLPKAEKLALIRAVGNPMAAEMQP